MSDGQMHEDAAVLQHQVSDRLYNTHYARRAPSMLAAAAVDRMTTWRRLRLAAMLAEEQQAEGGLQGAAAAGSDSALGSDSPTQRTGVRDGGGAVTGQQADPQDQPPVICISSEGADDVFDAYLLDSEAGCDQAVDDTGADSGDGSEGDEDNAGMLHDVAAVCMGSWAEEQLVAFEI
jgi:hypothetical protein